MRLNLQRSMDLNAQRKSIKNIGKVQRENILNSRIALQRIISPIGRNPIGGYDIPYEIDGYLSEIDTGMIDSDYMNSCFNRYLKALSEKSKNLDEITGELHKSFAKLTSEEQKYANIFLHDIQNGDVKSMEIKVLTSTSPSIAIMLRTIRSLGFLKNWILMNLSSER